jgi:hypothetical protein
MKSHTQKFYSGNKDQPKMLRHRVPVGDDSEFKKKYSCDEQHPTM